MKNMWTTVVVVLSGLGVLACGPKDSAPPTQVQGWETPDEAMRMGRGVDPYAADGSTVRGDCLAIDPETYTQKTWRDIADGTASTLTERRVSSYEDLLNELNISVSASIRGAFGCGSASYSKYQKYMENEENFTWIIKKEVERASVTLNIPDVPVETLLTVQAQEALAQGKEAFRRMCGSHFVRGMRLGGRFAYLQQVHAESADTVRKVEAHLKGQGGSLSLSGRARMDFAQLLMEAMRFHAYSRELVTIGPQVDLNKITIDSINTTLTEFEQGVTRDSAKPIAMDLAPWDVILQFPGNDPFLDLRRENRLKELHTRFWQNGVYLNKIGVYTMLAANGQIALSNEQIDGLAAATRDLERERTLITEAGSSCYRDTLTCDREIPPAVRVIFPVIDRTMSNWLMVEHEGWVFKSPVAKDLYRESAGQILSVGLEGQQVAETKSGKMVELSWSLRPQACGELDLKNYKNIPGKSLQYREYDLSDEGRLTDIDVVVQNNDRCLKVSFYTENNPDTHFTLLENSDASRLILRLATSITPL